MLCDPLSSLDISRRQTILNAATRLLDGLLRCSLPLFGKHWCLVPKRIQFKTSNTYAQVSCQVNAFISSDLTHLRLFTVWSLHSHFGWQRPSGWSPHAQCYCSTQKLRLCGLLQLELSKSILPFSCDSSS